MADDIDPQLAMIVYAKHLNGNEVNPVLDTYRGARESVEKNLKHVLRGSDVAELSTNMKKLDDFELIGITAHLQNKERLVEKSVFNGAIAAGASIVTGLTCGAMGLGWTFGMATTGVLFASAGIKVVSSIASWQRNESKMAALIHTTAKSRRSQPPPQEVPTPSV